jgi:hypothetical protein
MFTFNSAGSPGQELPLIMIDTIQDDPQVAIKTVQAAVDQAEPILRNLQQTAGVADNLMAHALITGAPTVSGGVTESRIKTTVIISVLGVLISLLIGVVVDVILSRRGYRPGRVPRAGDDVEPAYEYTDHEIATNPAVTAGAQ